MDQAGALLVDKPAGISSARVVERIKRAFGLHKVGHSGTLDPMATGLLVVLCGRATRLQDVFLNSWKGYEGEIRIGEARDTDDSEGAVTAADTEFEFAGKAELNVWAERLAEAFSGRQEQRPPRFSAIKIDGKRGYRRARAGEQFVQQPRQVEIEIAQLRFGSPQLLYYRLRCSKGTYVRSLARDMGEFLGSVAHLGSIRRLESDPFHIGAALRLEELEQSPIEDVLVPIDSLASGLPRVQLGAGECARLERGDQRPLADCPAPDSSRPGSLAAMVDSTGKLRGLLERQGGPAGWKVRCIL